MARKILRGNRGEISQAYRAGQQDQLGVLGPVLNAIVLWNTRYIDLAVNLPRAQGYPVRDEDAARLSPLGYSHINMLGRYSFPKPGDGPTAAPAARPRQPGELMRTKDIEPGREYGRTRACYTPHRGDRHRGDPASGQPRRRVRQTRPRPPERDHRPGGGARGRACAPATCCSTRPVTSGATAVTYRVAGSA